MLNMLAMVVKLEDLLPVLLTASAFVFLGLLIFAIAFIVIVFVSPFSVKKEIEDDQNIALAVIIGAVIIGISIIIGSAIQG
jgi:putative membrane protein